MEGMRILLEANNGPIMVAAETSVDEGAEAVRELRPELLILDRNFGANVVLDWLRLLREEQIRTSVIIWGAPISESEALRFIQSGARGVIRKTAPLNELLACICAVMAGRTWMEHDLLQDTEPAVRNGGGALTARELQVMELIERGMKNREIADALGITTGTVKIHLKHIFEKTGIRGRYGLALSGLRKKGLVEHA